MVYPVEVSCPYCGESFSTVVDGWGGSQTCVEDCAVCCRPVLLTLDIDANGTLQALHIAREDD
ncbi:MAG TPA: CPXCG motif-containing cysteine-rich protein [Gammaproteobacteria bacterium]|nr:CPXCG motif-containing cysteine-rich protein [Gammaproteobacteria bacterium]